MHKVVETVIGTGNKYSDVSFLWAANPQISPGADQEELLQQIGPILGMACRETVAVSEGETVLTQVFLKALLASNPRPLAGDAIRLIIELSRDVQDPAERRLFVKALTHEISRDREDVLSQWQRGEAGQLAGFDPEVLRNHILAAFKSPQIIVERSPPTAETVMSLVSKGSGVAIGAYLGFHTFENAPLLLYATVPGGMLLCGTAAGVAEALQLGLRERLYRWLAGSSRLCLQLAYRNFRVSAAASRGRARRAACEGSPKMTRCGVHVPSMPKVTRNPSVLNSRYGRGTEACLVAVAWARC
jgi:hypothetical protein